MGVSIIFSLWNCSKTDTSMINRSAQEGNHNFTSPKTQCTQKTETIKITDLSAISCDKQKIYLKQIAQWYYDTWGSYCPSDKPEPKYFQIPQCELIVGQLPVTLVAYDTIDENKLIAVARLKNDNVKDANGEKIFPDGIYRLSGLYVDQGYRNRGIARTIVQQALSIAIERYDAPFLGFFSHSKEAHNIYKHYGIPLHSMRKIHDAEAAIYLIENPLELLQKLQ